MLYNENSLLRFYCVLYTFYMVKLLYNLKGIMRRFLKYYLVPILFLVSIVLVQYYSWAKPIFYFMSGATTLIMSWVIIYDMRMKYY